MNYYLTKHVRFIWPGLVVLCALFTGEVKTAHAWTSAYLFNVDVNVDIPEDGLSTVTTDARFVVEAGHFHGFDLMDMPGGEIDKTACFAFRDDGRRYNVSFKRVRGRTRVVLADDEDVEKGGVTFQIIHKIDLMAQGALRYYEGRARFDWTPLIWDEGLDNMTVYLQLPKRRHGGQIEVNQAASRDYVVEVGDRHVNFIKYRPVRWYPMRLVMDFNPRLIAGLAPTKEIETPEEPAQAIATVWSDAPPQFKDPLAALFPAIIALVALLALIWKFHHVRSVYRQTGLLATPALLSNTTFALRIGLSFIAVAVGLGVQYRGHLAAGIPAMTVAAALFLMCRKEVEVTPRPGGKWRRMGDDDIANYQRLASAYLGSRASLVDITTVRGVLTFSTFLASLCFGAYTVRSIEVNAVRMAVIDGLILSVPAWFGSIRAELPVDPTLEGFHTLRKWRKSLSRLLGTRTPGAEAEFWVREDNSGPIEVRLRAAVPVDGLNNIEIGAETVRAGSIFKTRTVFVLRLEPGTEVARTLAACPHAAEHHLTPDLEEEIIVLRNRRGRTTSGLSPLRTALSLIS